MAAELAPSPKRNRTRSPSYPYLNLPAALEKAAVLWKAEGRHPVAVNLAMQHWGYKEESSTGYSCIAALKKFGLVDHEGMGETRQIRLSNLALTILLDDDPSSAERRDALRTAALGPRIHAELWERYGAELPSGQSLRRFLVLERAFNEASVDELLEEYRQTMAFADLGVGAIRGATPPTPAVPPPAPSAGPAPRPLSEPGVYESARRQELPNAAPRMPARAVGAPGAGWNGVPPAGAVSAPTRQPSLFDADDDADDGYDGGRMTEETTLPVRPATAGPSRDPADPWSGARRELPVPLDNDLVARVPYPMTEEDFALLLDTLQLWKKRLVRSRR